MEVDEDGGSPSPTHGTKRPASDAWDGEQRLTKRFRALSLNNVDAPAVSQPEPQYAASDVSGMQLDDTKDTIYIHDLEKELQEVDEPTDRIEFLPDIEKHFTGIPQALLTSKSDNKDNKTSKEVVLYHVPSSITVPEAQDNVRKAIIEARARSRAERAKKDAHPVFSTETHNAFQPTPNGHVNMNGNMDMDEMDIE